MFLDAKFFLLVEYQLTSDLWWFFDACGGVVFAQIAFRLHLYF